ncbi:hypothetical protein H5410_013534, partial [Solanum commersonii]
MGVFSHTSKVLLQPKNEESKIPKSKSLEMKPSSSSIHHLLAPSFGIVMLWVIGQYSTTSWNFSMLCRVLPCSVTLILSVRLSTLEQKCPSFPSIFKYLKLKQTRVQLITKGVSNSARQDSIMNVHNNTQITHAKINCVLKDLSCDTPLPKILMRLINSRSGIRCDTHTKNEEHNACFNHRFALNFQSTFNLAYSRSKRFFLRLVIGLSAK